MTDIEILDAFVLFLNQRKEPITTLECQILAASMTSQRLNQKPISRDLPPVPDLKANEIIVPLSPFDDLSDDEVLYWHSPFYDDIQIQKEAQKKKLAENSND